MRPLAQPDPQRAYQPAPYLSAPQYQYPPPASTSVPGIAASSANAQAPVQAALSSQGTIPQPGSAAATTTAATTATDMSRPSVVYDYSSYASGSAAPAPMYNQQYVVPGYPQYGYQTADYATAGQRQQSTVAATGATAAESVRSGGSPSTRAADPSTVSGGAATTTKRIIPQQQYISSYPGYYTQPQPYQPVGTPLYPSYGYGGYGGGYAVYNQLPVGQQAAKAMSQESLIPGDQGSSISDSSPRQMSRREVRGHRRSRNSLDDSTLNPSVGQVQPPGLHPRITTIMWEDEKTLCYQVEANGVAVVRRADNDMINGTKLLNVAKMTRGRRDGILKAEKTRHVVKIGSMHLKGVWIPFERALLMAQREGIVDLLYPLFVKDIKRVIQQGNTTFQSGYFGSTAVQKPEDDAESKHDSNTSREKLIPASGSTGNESVSGEKKAADGAAPTTAPATDTDSGSIPGGQTTTTTAAGSTASAGAGAGAAQNPARITLPSIQRRPGEDYTTPLPSLHQPTQPESYIPASGATQPVLYNTYYSAGTPGTQQMRTQPPGGYVYGGGYYPQQYRMASSSQQYEDQEGRP